MLFNIKLTINIILKTRRARRSIPDLRNKTQEKEVLLFTGIIITRGHYARAKIYVYNQSLMSIRIFHPST